MHRHDRLWLHRPAEFSQERAPRFKCRNSAQYVAITAADHCMWQKVSQENDVDRIRYRTGGAALPVTLGTKFEISTFQTVRIMEPTLARDWLHYRIMEEKRTAISLKWLPIRGGNWNNGSNAGLAALNLNNARSNSNTNIGFRPALANVRNVSAMADSTVHCKKDAIAMARSQNIDQIPQCADVSLFSQIIAFDNLHSAALKAQKGKRHRHEVAAFFANLEENLIELQNQLIWQQYQTGVYRNFYVYEPKKRLVAALPFKDRVVQHAIVTVIEPLFEKRFITDSYACRVGKGTHAGADRAQRFIRIVQQQYGHPYVLKADISKYFASIDRSILMTIMARQIDCSNTLKLLAGIIDSYPGTTGIPIGNLTSQLCANVYLHELDHFVKHQLNIKYYVRYMDDFVIVSHDKMQLQHWRLIIEQFLQGKLHLQTNAKTQIFPVKKNYGRAVDFLGYRIYSTHRLLRKNSIKRIKHKLKKYRMQLQNRTITIKSVHQKLQSWIGHCKHCNSYRLRLNLFMRLHYV